MKNLTKYFITGLLTLVPIIVSLIIILYIIDYLSLVLSWVSDSSNPLIVIISFGLTILFILGLGRGVVSNNPYRAIGVFENIIMKFPILGKITETLKEFTNMVQGKGKFEYLGVARVPFANGKTNALITNVEVVNGTKEYTVFIVTGTFPPTGFVCYYEEKDVQIVEGMAAKDVFQLQISLGIK